MLPTACSCYELSIVVDRMAKPGSYLLLSTRSGKALLSSQPARFLPRRPLSKQNLRTRLVERLVLCHRARF